MNNDWCICELVQSVILPSGVTYIAYLCFRRMPDIDSLMQEWPGEVEELLKEVNLPTAALEMELTDYIDIICGLYTPSKNLSCHCNLLQNLFKNKGTLFSLSYCYYCNLSHLQVFWISPCTRVEFNLCMSSSLCTRCSRIQRTSGSWLKKTI